MGEIENFRQYDATRRGTGHSHGGATLKGSIPLDAIGALVKLILLALIAISSCARAATNPVYAQNDSQYVVVVKTFLTEFSAGGESLITSPNFTLNPGQSMQYTPSDPGRGTAMGLTGSIVPAVSNDDVICVKRSKISFADARTQEYCASTFSTDFFANGFPGSALYIVISNNAPPQCSATTVSWGASNFCTAAVGTTANGVSVGVVNTTAGASGSAQALCSSGVWQVQNPVCTASLAAPASVSATDGTVVGKVSVTWSGVANATGYDLQYRKQGTSTWIQVAGVASGWQLTTTDESTFEFQVVARNGLGQGAWSGVDTGYIARSCATATLNWGAGNFCSASAASGAGGTVRSLTNGTAGASGTATATCSAITGTWTVTSPVCTGSLVAPTWISATDGTMSGAIGVTWGAISGAATYRLQYRKQGTSSWTDLYAASANSYNWTGLSDESVFEFQVRAENSLGVSAWSPVDPGWIRTIVAPLFVSQSGIPAKIGVGQSFTFSQVWRNIGSETWTGSGYGTAHYAAGGAIQWGIPFTAFPGSTPTNAEVTTTMTATAPAVPGTYKLQRIMQKGSTSYGAPSTVASILVLDTPKCSAINTNITTTFNPNATITATLSGVSSVEAADLRVWGTTQGMAGGASYQMTYNGTAWIVTFPIAPHLPAGETTINLSAAVSNSVFAPSTCATSTVAFQHLPIPQITLKPTLGSYDGAGRIGMVADRTSGAYATGKVDLGAFSALKVKIEFTNDAQVQHGAPISAGAAGVDIPLQLLGTKLAPDVPAWSETSGYLKVSYADPDAAAQGKVAIQPIAVRVTPSALQVSAAGTVGVQPSVNAKVRDANGSFSQALLGPFVGGVRTVDSIQVSDFQPIDEGGAWTAQGLDYSKLYKTQLVAVARATPPAGVTLLKPIEFLSPAFVLPVQMVRELAATDGTLEEVVRVSWLIPAAGGEGFTYDVYRADSLISGGVSALEYVDVPPVRGQVYTYKVVAKLNALASPPAEDPGHLPACFAPRVEDALVNGVMQAELATVSRWLQCVPDAEVSVAFDGGAPAPVPFAATSGSDYRFAAIDISGLANGTHTAVFTVDKAGALLNASRSQSFTFAIDRSGLLPTDLTILHNGKPAPDGVVTDSIGRFGIQLQGGSIDFAQPLN